ncbi:tetratricopeptide repeat protein [Thauera mechernichensis]
MYGSVSAGGASSAWRRVGVVGAAVVVVVVAAALAWPEPPQAEPVAALPTDVERLGTGRAAALAAQVVVPAAQQEGPAAPALALASIREPAPAEAMLWAPPPVAVDARAQARAGAVAPAVRAKVEPQPASAATPASVQATRAAPVVPAAALERPLPRPPVRPDGALQVEQTAVDVGDGLARFNRMVARGEFAAAEALIDELRGVGLNALALARMTGFLTLRAGRHDEARAAYEHVLVQLPNDREAALNLALVDLRQGFAAEAEQRLRRIAELRPDDEQVRALLGQVRAQGRAQ